MPSIVCVDDDPLFQEVVAKAAESMGASCSGVSTIAQARATIPDARPDIVVVDGLLPDGSGTNLVRALRMELGFTGKIVFASAFFKDLRSFQKLRAAGADRILQKPIEAHTLRKELASLVPQPAAAPEPKAEVAQVLATMSAGYRRQLEGKAARLEGLLQQARDGDEAARSEVTRQVHSLAGSAGSFGLSMLSDLARAIDTRLQAGDSLDACDEGLQTLLHEMRRAAAPEQATDRQPQGPGWPWSMLLVTPTPKLGQRYERELATRRVHLRTADSVDDAVLALQHFCPDVLVFDGMEAATMGTLATLLPRFPVVMLGADRSERPPPFETLGREPLVVPRDEPASRMLEDVRRVFSQPLAGRTVLVVDPDPNTGRVLMDSLQPLGIEVRMETAFSGFIKHLSATPPHVLLFEVDLPGMSGFEICRLARADRGFRDVPVLCLSAKHDAERRLRALRCGADGLLSKPVEPTELMARVTRRIKQGLLAEAWVERLRG